MKEEISKPNLREKIGALCSELEVNGQQIKWYVDSSIRGNASVNPVKRTISFRGVGDVTEDNVCHELLHLRLYDQGYPMLYDKFGYNELAIIMLNDVFQHIMMKPRLKELGFSIEDQEGPGIVRLVENLNEGLRIVADKEAFTAIFFLRAHTMSAAVPTLEKYILKNNKVFTMEKIDEIIRNRLPSENFTPEEYSERLRSCLFALDLQNEVIWKVKN